VVVFVVRPSEGGSDFLFLQRSGGRFTDQWWPIAGTREDGESPVETAVREIEEETGLTPDAVHATGIVAPRFDQPGNLQIFVAFVTPDSEVRLNYEHSDFQWLSLDEVLTLRDVSRRFVESQPPDASRVWP
jgi:dATP pyrophosphohydrolase